MRSDTSFELSWGASQFLSVIRNVTHWHVVFSRLVSTRLEGFSYTSVATGDKKKLVSLSVSHVLLSFVAKQSTALLTTTLPCTHVNVVRARLHESAFDTKPFGCDHSQPTMQHRESATLCFRPWNTSRCRPKRAEAQGPKVVRTNRSATKWSEVVLVLVLGLPPTCLEKKFDEANRRRRSLLVHSLLRYDVAFETLRLHRNTKPEQEAPVPSFLHSQTCSILL